MGRLGAGGAFPIDMLEVNSSPQTSVSLAVQLQQQLPPMPDTMYTSSHLEVTHTHIGQTQSLCSCSQELWGR